MSVPYFERLRELGYSVETSTKGRAQYSEYQYTWLIKKNGRSLGVVYEAGAKTTARNPLFLTYSFPVGRLGDGSIKRRDRVPDDYDHGAFCEAYGLDPEKARYERSGKVGEFYLRVRDEGSAIKLLNQTAIEDLDDLLDGVPPWIQEKSREAFVMADIAEIERSTRSETTKQRLIEARLGQGRYRKSLDVIFANACAVSGLSAREALRASHIHPFRDATDEQKLDANNGLLLSANLDALFDKHLITFDIKGQVRLSAGIKALDAAARATLGPFGNLRISPTPGQQKYLKMHNQVFEKKHAEYIEGFDSEKIDKTNPD